MSSVPSSQLLELEVTDNGLIKDFVTNDELEDRPEERVRQYLQRLLHFQFGYPKDRIGREATIYYGGKPAVDSQGNPVRADVAVYRTVAAKKRGDQGAIELVCETKRPKLEEGYNQLVSYIFNTSAEGGVWFNGDMRTWRRVGNDLHDWPTLPRFKEQWEAVGRRKKSDLRPLIDAHGTLRRCHDRIHRRGTTDDIALTMVRILLAKWHDEEKPGELTEFYCTPEEYSTHEGRKVAAKRAKDLFIEVRDANRTVFDKHEQIGGTADEIVEVMAEIQEYRLLGDEDEQWNLMGAAYEQYTAEEMKREGGEFFTNRLVVNLLTKMANVSPNDIILDPAGGTGGFCSAALRHARRVIRQTIGSKTAQQRAIDKLKDRIFLIEKKPRLVKLAKASMIVSGNGHRGFMQADALRPLESLPEEFRRLCPPGNVSVVMTNPPWAGMVNGRIADPSVLQHFEVGHRWTWHGDRYESTDELISTGVPPEYLFVEQCIKWLAPNGRLAIVLPKGILDNMEPAMAVRHYLFRHCKVEAIINCHKNTFQPYTGSRGCLIYATKKRHADDSRNYKIFMAINRKIGQDSEGLPIFKSDQHGRPTKDLDQDLDDIYDAWLKHKSGRLKESEYIFTIKASALDDRTLRANPQFYLPSLNETIKRIVELDGSGFTVERLGDRIATNIWKGLRFKREDLDTDRQTQNTVTYYTPTSIFMRGEGTKFLDLSKCSAGRRRIILRHAAQEGEILITRSGTIGRVVSVGRTLKGAILSDDLIRVSIADPVLRAYVFAYLQSVSGQDQLLRNEYGTVQQHLEPSHVADVLVAIPDDRIALEQIARIATEAIEQRERSIELEEQGKYNTSALVGGTPSPSSALRGRFMLLMTQWREACAHASKQRDMVAHPSYQEIIGMGAAAIPLMLEELQRSPDHLAPALRAITGIDPAKSQPRGKIKMATDAWIKWGIKQGHIQE